MVKIKTSATIRSKSKQVMFTDFIRHKDNLEDTEQLLENHNYENLALKYRTLYRKSLDDMSSLNHQISKTYTI